MKDDNLIDQSAQIANQMKLGQDSRLIKSLDRVDILIFPCLNPDGYEYTRSEPRNPAVCLIFDRSY
jgi:murein tripeptide amidase MpaA